MADVKESALTQKSDCKWVRALDENGNSIRISKNDLASVVGELIDTKYIFNTELGASAEIDLGLNYYGLFLLSCPTNGGTAFYKIGSTTSCFLHGYKSGGSELFGDFTSSGSEKIIFGRKDFGGNIFVKNNDVRTLTIRIKMIRG